MTHDKKLRDAAARTKHPKGIPREGFCLSCRQTKPDVIYYRNPNGKRGYNRCLSCIAIAKKGPQK